MKNNQSIWKSFHNAQRGIFYFFRNERNGQIQLLASLLLLVAGFYFHLNKPEWIAVVLNIGLIICLEMCNSALEKICDLITPDYHPVIRVIKDVSAGAVLWASIIGIITGIIVFGPKIYKLL